MAIPADERTPYSDVHDDSGYTTRLTTMAEVAFGLERVLARLVADAGKWILILELGPLPAQVRDGDCRSGVCVRGYLQWLVYPDGSFVSEVSSSRSLDPAHTLTDEQEEQLAALGWHAPEDHPGAPNFYLVSIDPAEVTDSAERALKTMREVFAADGDEVMLVKMTESHRLDLLSPLEEANEGQASA